MSSYPPPPPDQPYPSYGGGDGGAGTPPGNNLVWGILTTLFCCLPFGIVSIVQAAKVDSLWSGGRHAEARAAAASAKKWAIIAAVSGFVVIGGYLLLMVVIGMSVGFDQMQTDFDSGY